MQHTTSQTADRPNIIMVMCDDLGYGDTGFNGNRVIQTPHLDQLRGEGGLFTRFFAGGPVCSPTRGTCLTGRHYSRYGITHANEGALPRQELTLATICRQLGYRTGHFGKWHLGTLTESEPDGNRGGAHNAAEFSPPWEHGYEVCFATESKVPTWDPMLVPDEPGPKGQRWGIPGAQFGTAYWDQNGQRVRDNLSGDDSRVIMDRVEPFIRSAAAAGQPFFTTVWFHTPHSPVVAGPEYRAMYAGYNEDQQHYYGCVTAMDEQVDRLNNLLKTLGVEQDTVVWFCSDNGPEGSADLSRNARNQGVTGGLRGRKRSLFNGGIAVPALVKWPKQVAAGSVFTMPCSTLDYLPTIVDYLGSQLDYQLPDTRPIDGCSLLPLFAGATERRPKPIPYRFLERKAAMFDAPTFGLIDQHFKFLTNLSEGGLEDLLFDIDADMVESANIIAQHPQRAATMRNQVTEFAQSFRRSHYGADYPQPYQPVNEFQEVTGRWADNDE